jgi:hypothetical protein
MLINVGNIYRVTLLEYVPGLILLLEEGKHSRMDLVGYSKDGKTSNLPIVMTDSTLISIRKQGETVLLYHTY